MLPLGGQGDVTRIGQVLEASVDRDHTLDVRGIWHGWNCLTVSGSAQGGMRRELRLNRGRGGRELMVNG